MIYEPNQFVFSGPVLPFFFQLLEANPRVQKLTQVQAPEFLDSHLFEDGRKQFEACGQFTQRRWPLSRATFHFHSFQGFFFFQETIENAGKQLRLLKRTMVEKKNEKGLNP